MATRVEILQNQQDQTFGPSVAITGQPVIIPVNTPDINIPAAPSPATLTLVGNNNVTFNTIGTTLLTLPQQGTVATFSNLLSDFASTSSIQLRSIITDTTGTGKLVFSNSPSFIAPKLGQATAVSLTAGKINNLTISSPVGAVLSFSSNVVFTVAADATIAGNNTGDQTITLTGDVTGSGNGSFGTTIGSNKVTNDMLSHIATATFKGRMAAGPGNVEDLSATQATALLNTFTSGANNPGLKGLVPSPTSADVGKFLKGDGTWGTVPSGEQGIQGVKGDDGEQGIQGIQGIQGVKGDDGEQGIQGVKGDDGDGNVSKVGTPSDNQVGVWTGDGTIEGDTNLTFDTTTDTLSTGAVSLAAGTATQAPIKLTAGTNLTTAEAGAIEMDADCFYGCIDAGNRGVITVQHFIRAANATRTFVSNTDQQAIFDNPANGALTLEPGTYMFEGLIAMTSMSSTTGNGKFSLIGAGTATLAAILWRATGQDVQSGGTAAAQGGSWHIVATQVSLNIVTATAAQQLCFSLQGTFEVSVAGTIIPSFAHTTAAEATVSTGSYFKCSRVGSTGVTHVGQWS